MIALLSIAEWIGVAFAIVGIGLLVASDMMSPSAAEFRGTTPSFEVRSAIWRAMGLAGLVQVLVIVILTEFGRGPRTSLGIWALLGIVGVIGWVTAGRMLLAIWHNLVRKAARVSLSILAFLPLIALCATSPDATTVDKTWTATALLGVTTILVGADLALRVTSKAAHMRRSPATYLLITTVVAATLAMAALRWWHQEQRTFAVGAGMLAMVAVTYLVERETAEAGTFTLMGAALGAAAVACLLTWWALIAFVPVLLVSLFPVVADPKNRGQTLGLTMRFAGIPLALVVLEAVFDSLGRL